MYHVRYTRPMLYYYGAAPEVPGGTAIVLMNPLRDRAGEDAAERLIHDLRTADCEKIVRSFDSNPEMCPVLQNNKKANLIWRVDRGYDRTLFYELSETRFRLKVYAARGEGGLGVRQVFLIQ